MSRLPNSFRFRTAVPSGPLCGQPCSDIDLFFIGRHSGRYGYYSYKLKSSVPIRGIRG